MLANFFDQFDEPSAAPGVGPWTKYQTPNQQQGSQNGPWTKYQNQPDKKPNFFDQFDTPAQAPVRIIQFEGRRVQVPGDATDDEIRDILSSPPETAQQPAKAPNFFDQFDAPAAASAVVAAQPQAATPAPQAAPSVASDIPASFGSGIVRGAAETAMLPVTVERLGSAAAGFIANHGENVARSAAGAPPVTDADRQARTNSVADAGTDFARWLFGAPPLSDQDRAQRHDVVAGMEGGAGNVGYQAQDAARKVMDDNLYAPKTTPGKFAETVGEFAVPGGVPSRSARLAPGVARKAIEYGADLGRGAVIPGLASEAAGQSTEGTSAEPYARVIAAILGNTGGAVLKSASAPEAVLRRAVGPADAVDWNRAIALQNNPTGIRLTGPEAITQAQDGASALPNLQRVIEGSVEGRAATAPFFAERPGQVDRAVGNVLDQIAPQSATPSALGPRVAQAAEGAINASPEGQALLDAIFGAGPRTTSLQAGEVIQPELRNLFDRREGMRNALADADYAAARQAPANVPVEDMMPVTTTTRPAFTRIEASGADDGAPGMTPRAIPAQTQTPALTSRTGGEHVQVDARPVVQFIDNLIPGTRAGTQDALHNVRNMLFDSGGVDTGVNGLDAARGQIGDMITAAVQGGQRQTADMLGQVQRQLDNALATVPEYANARQGFQAASVPLQPFQSPGMARTISRDEFNARFGTPAEQVPDALATPSEARNFNAVATPEARTAMENRVATMLMDQATDGAGKVSGERLALALRNNEDLLSQFPEVAARLHTVVGASGNMARARTGPIGELASAPNTTAAGNAILPQNPLVGSQGETADAVRRLSAQDADATAALLRQILSNRYSEAATEMQEGSREFAGAKFNKDVAGNGQRRATLDAALGALPNNAAAQATPELLDVLQATGRRKQIGSATEFNRSTNAELANQNPLARLFTLVKSAGVSHLINTADTVKRAALRNSIGTLADLFTDPRSVELIREAMARGAPNILPGVGARAIAQAAPIFDNQPAK